MSSRLSLALALTLVIAIGGRTTTTTTTTTNMTSSIVEVSAYELRVLFSISSVGVIVDNKSMAVSFAS